MDLIQIIDEGSYTGIVYPNERHRSLRNILLKDIGYDSSTGSILMKWKDSDTVELIYTNVEDPNSPGNPLSSIDDLWDLIISIVGSSVDISNFTFNDGNNFVFLDGNNFIFNS
jgi:hypothetical protein